MAETRLGQYVRANSAASGRRFVLTSSSTQSSILPWSSSAADAMLFCPSVCAAEANSWILSALQEALHAKGGEEQGEGSAVGFTSSLRVHHRTALLQE